MKKFFEYVGLSALVAFSFYYTDKAIEITKENDPLMVSITEYAESTSTKCSEGYVTESGVVLGVNGINIDINESYRNMKGFGFDESLLVFDETECKVNGKDNLNNYIIRGNEKQNAVSLMIELNDGSLIKEIVKLTEEKKIKIDFITNGSILETYKEYFSLIYENGYGIIYGGSEKTDLNKYISIMNEFNKNSNKYCVYNESVDILELCAENKINTIKTDNIFYKDLLKNTKDSLDKGAFIIYKENSNTLKELSSIVNFINAKGIEIKTLQSHL